jgi:putative acetyltransferase
MPLKFISLFIGEEMDRINEYYGDRKGGFWVAARGEEVVGMFGLEPASSDALELRRMYVTPSARRAGIARSMLGFAEGECRRRKVRRLELSTSELQPAAVELYKGAGYQLLQEIIVEQASNKTVGGAFGDTISRNVFRKAFANALGNGPVGKRECVGSRSAADVGNGGLGSKRTENLCKPGTTSNYGTVAQLLSSRPPPRPKRAALPCCKCMSQKGKAPRQVARHGLT